MTTQRRAAALAPVLVLMTLVASIISSVGAPLLPTIAKHFHDSLSTAQWSLTAALLTGAVTAPILGRLGDGPRRRETMIGGLAVVTVGGVIAAVAGSLGLLVAGRAMQGVGLGILPLAMATARDELPKEKVVPMIGLLSVSAAAGVGVGYPLSGLIADATGLSGAYWFAAAVAAVAVLSVAAVVPANAHSERSAQLDWVGGTLLTGALIGLLIAVAQGSIWGWGSARIIGLLIIGLALFAAWAVQELRIEAPLVQLRLLRHPAVLAADVCATVLGVAMYMDLSAITEFVQLPRSGGFGFSASVVVAGLILVPLSVMMFAGSRFLPRLVRYLGVRMLLTLGCLVVACGGCFFALCHNALWEAFVMMGVTGIGLGTTYAAIPGLIVQAVPQSETGSAMGFYQVVRYVGFSLGSALAASILSSHPSQALKGQPALSGYTTVLWIGGAICVVASALAWILSARGNPVPASERIPNDEITLVEQTDGDDLVVTSERID